MVTKKQRRTRLARAAEERREARRTRREARNRRLRVLAATLTAIIAVVGLVVWISTHDDRTSGASASVDYDAWSASLASDFEPDIRRGIP